jgi:hypothetical protein
VDELLEHALKIASSTSNDGPSLDLRNQRRQRRELKRQLNICAYKVKHFLALRTFFIAEMAKLDPEVDEDDCDEDVEMAETEADPSVSVCLAPSFTVLLVLQKSI